MRHVRLSPKALSSRKRIIADGLGECGGLSRGQTGARERIKGKTTEGTWSLSMEIFFFFFLKFLWVLE